MELQGFHEEHCWRFIFASNQLCKLQIAETQRIYFDRVLTSRYESLFSTNYNVVSLRCRIGHGLTNSWIKVIYRKCSYPPVGGIQKKMLFFCTCVLRGLLLRFDHSGGGVVDCHKRLWLQLLLSVKTHWGRDKMAAFFDAIFSNAFSWMKMFKFRLRFQWILLRERINNIPALVQIMALHRRGEKTLSEPMIVYWRIYASLGLNELALINLVRFIIMRYKII